MMVDDLQIELECLTVCAGDLTDMSFLCLSWKCARNNDMEGNREIGG